jgi:hypothetical protein
MKARLLAATIALAMCGTLSAQIITYVESVSGDLSGTATAPTFLSFGLGQNTVSGTMGRPPGGAIDRDIFTFKVQEWERITAITLLRFEPVAAPGPIGSFFAISGTNTINLTNPSTHLSNRLVSGPGELLPLLIAGAFSDTLGTQPATQGIRGPLGQGDYTIWFQELSTSVNYTLGVTVTAVPEPATYAMGGGALLLAVCLLRRRARSRGMARA